MNTINILGFLSLAFGIFLLLSKDPVGEVRKTIEIAKKGSNLFAFEKKRKPIGKRIAHTRKPKKKNSFLELIEDARNMAMLSGQDMLLSWSALLSIAFMAIGVWISIAIIKNYYLVPAAMIGLGVMPYLYLIYASLRWQKSLAAELETVLSIITTSYIRKENIIDAVAENISYINPPLKRIFEVFLLEANYMGSSVKSNLRSLQKKIHNDIWKEWIEALIACQENKELKVTLTPIVAKLSDGRLLTEELNNILYAPIKEYILLVLFFFGNFFIMKMAMPEWYHYLVTKEAGKITIGISTALILFSIPGVMALTKPIEHKKKGT